jgi:hypothetical protein
LPVNTIEAGDQSPSDVFLTPDGPVLRGGVCFEGTSQVGAATEVYCRTGIYGDADPYLAGGDAPRAPVVPSNQLEGTEFQVNTFTTGYQGRPTACGLGNGEFVVAWTDFVQVPNFSSVFARRVDLDDGPVGEEFEVSTAHSAYVDFPQICCSRNGFVVVWQNGPGPTPVDGDAHSVSARLFDTDATPVGTEFVVNRSTVGTQWLPALACDRRGNFVVTWQSTTPSAEGAFARAFGADGSPLTDETRITPQSVTLTAGMAGGAAAFAWSAVVTGGDDEEVLARRYSIPGVGESTTTTTTTTTSTLGSTTTTTTGAPAICGDPVDPGALRLGDPSNAVTASDALRTLQAAVGSSTCLLCVCDVNNSGSLTATDALVVLRKAVGAPATLTCPAC